MERQPSTEELAQCSSCQNTMPYSHLPIHRIRCSMQTESKILKSKLKHSKANGSCKEKDKLLLKRQQRKSKVFKFTDNQKYEDENAQQMENMIEFEQNFPCIYCGYMQSLLELDSHPLKCKGLGTRCQYCNQSYPAELMSDHHNVCANRPFPQQSEEQPDQQIPSQPRQNRISHLFRLMGVMNNLLEAIKDGETEKMSKQQIDQLNHQIYKKKEEDELCTICYCNLEEDQSCIYLKCKHVYHEECITKWLGQNSTCPVCKGKQKQPNEEKQEKSN